jgi:dimethylhistidine N-methyltransferase
MIKTDDVTPFNFKFYDFQPKLLDFKTEVLNGLTKYPKVLPPKLFYDVRGSSLFEEITTLKEYYIPAIEKKLLRDNIFSINKLLGNDVLLIEPGSGNGEKAKNIFRTHKSIKAYIPIEISKEFLYNSAVELAREFPQTEILPVCADYLSDFNLPELGINNRTLFFPGSSIGNYEIEDVIKILQKFIKMVNYHGGLLIGVDLKKDKETLELAYNDTQGITAQFNLNLLHRIKKELGADINIDNFYHKSLYNEDKGRIEMYLVSANDYSFKINDITLTFSKDEQIHTENSYKYSIEEFKKIGFNAGYKEHTCWTDRENYFSIHYFKV